MIQSNTIRDNINCKSVIESVSTTGLIRTKGWSDTKDCNRAFNDRNDITIGTIKDQTINKISTKNVPLYFPSQEVKI